MRTVATIVNSANWVIFNELRAYFRAEWTHEWWVYRTGTKKWHYTICLSISRVAFNGNSMNVFGFIDAKFDRIFVLQLEKLNLETKLIFVDICVCFMLTYNARSYWRLFMWFTATCHLRYFAFVKKMPTKSENLRRKRAHARTRLIRNNSIVARLMGAAQPPCQIISAGRYSFTMNSVM